MTECTWPRCQTAAGCKGACYVAGMKNALDIAKQIQAEPFYQCRPTKWMLEELEKKIEAVSIGQNEEMPV